MTSIHRGQMKPQLIRSVLACAIFLGAAGSGCRYWAGPLPLGATNADRAADHSTAQAWAQPMTLQSVPNLHKVSDDLYRGAQPTTEGFKALEGLGIVTIVNLRDDHDDEQAIRGTDLAYERIPMTAWRVDEAAVARFLRVATDEKNTPVLVHCQRGADRTGLACAIYRVAVQGWTKDEAIAEMTQGGFRFYSGWQNLIRYVRDVDVDQLKRRAGLTTAPSKRPN